MTWLRLDDRFATHPKVAGLSDRAFRLHVLGLCYAAEFNTDGFCPRYVGKIVGLSRAQITAKSLVAAGLWEPIEGGWLIHDFLDYNPSKEQVDRDKGLHRERQARYMERLKGDASSAKARDASVTVPRPDPRIKGFTVTQVPRPYVVDEPTETVDMGAVKEALAVARDGLAKSHPRRPTTEGNE